MQTQPTPQSARERRDARQIAHQPIPSAAHEKALRSELAGELGVRDACLIDRLLALGITPDTASAFEALPLIEVAWADGFVDEEERWRVLAAATAFGLELGRPAHAQLELWMARRPCPSLFDAWYALAAARRNGEPGWPGADRLSSGLREVAVAAGGVLGFGTVSRVERKTIARIHAALGRRDSDRATDTPGL